MRPRAKLTIDSLQDVVYEKSIGTKMIEPLFRGRITVMSTIASHSPLNISETVTGSGLVPKDH